MTHGHPESYDDAILESGNHNAKMGKRILFWGGTSEVDEKGNKIKYAQQRSTGKRDGQGNLIMKTVMHTANDSIEQQHLENTLLRQTFAMAREAGKSEAQLATEAVKSEQYAKQCETVTASLDKMAAALPT